MSEQIKKKMLVLLLFLPFVISRDGCRINLNQVTISEFFVKNRNKSVQIPPVKEVDNWVESCDFSDPEMAVSLNFSDNEAFAKFAYLIEDKKMMYAADWNKVTNPLDGDIDSHALTQILYNLYMEDDWDEPQRRVMSPSNRMFTFSVVDILAALQPKNYKKNRTIVTVTGPGVPMQRNWLSKVSQTAVKMRQENLTQHFIDSYNYVEENYERREANIIDTVSKNVKNFFGFYDYDNEGRKSLPMLTTLYHVIVELDQNPELFNYLASSIINGTRNFKREFLQTFSYVQQFYEAFVQNPEFIRLGIRFYDTLFGERRKQSFEYFRLMINNANFDPFNIESKSRMDERFHRAQQESFMLTQRLRSQTYLRSEDSDLMRHTPHHFASPMRSYAYAPYNSSEVSVVTPSDWFSRQFWDPTQAWWTGFKIGKDRMTMRPTNPTGWVSVFVPSPLVLMGFVPADSLSMTWWAWKWFFRGNTSLTWLPFISNVYEAPNIQGCLPPFPYLPDPEYGCGPPFIANVAPCISDEGFEELFQLDSCFPWMFPIGTLNPLAPIEGGIQVVLTPLLFDVAGIFLIINDLLPIQLINPSGEVSELQNYCTLPQVPINLLIVIFIVIITIQFLFLVFLELSLVWTDISTARSESKDLDLKQELKYFKMIQDLILQNQKITYLYNEIAGKLKTD